MKTILWDDFCKMAKTDEKFSLTIGNFDGFHAGHEEIFRQMKFFQEKNPKTKVAVITFLDLKNENAIMTRDLKIAFFKKNTVDLLILLDNFEKIARMSGEVFFENIISHVNVVHFLVGQDFACGKNRSFGVAEMKIFAKKNDFSCDFIKNVEVEKMQVHSTFLRKLILEGDLEKAKMFFGHGFFVDCSNFSKKAEGFFQKKEQILPKNGKYFAKIFLTDDLVDENIFCSVEINDEKIRIENANFEKIFASELIKFVI